MRFKSGFRLKTDFFCDCTLNSNSIGNKIKNSIQGVTARHTARHILSYPPILYTNMTFDTISAEMARAKALYANHQYDECLHVLHAAKAQFIQLSSYLCHEQLRAESAHEAQTARDAFEYACLCHARQGSAAGFRLEFGGLRYYYDESLSGILPESPKQPLLTGLYFLTLLIDNRIGEFHAELEQCAPEALSSVYIRPIIEIERHLMDGTFTKVVEARQTVPTNDYDVFLQKLIARVTQTIAEGIEASCQTIPLPAAQHLLSIGGNPTLTAEALAGLKAKGVVSQNVLQFSGSHSMQGDAVPHREMLRMNVAKAKGTTAAV